MSETPEQSGAKPPVVEMKGITKRFGRVLANDHVDFTVHGGEVHALLGENGAGKTTLMNILYGLYRADSGEIIVRGKSVSIRSPRDAIALKIAMVHQHFELVSTLSVAENIGLGLKAKREPLLDLETVSDRIDQLARQYELSVNPRARVETLSVGERQRVEIIKALYREPDLLILDEPTSVLTPQEVGGFFQFIRSMAGEGRAVIVITHKLAEVMSVSDRVTVLRRGQVVARLETKNTNPDELAEKMVGKSVLQKEGIPEVASSKQTILQVKNLSARSDKGAVALDRVSFEVGQGEILGVAGVAGNGQAELAETLTGMRKATAGQVIVNGVDLTNASPDAFITNGVGQVPEDRIGSGLILDMSIAENLVLEIRRDARFEKRYLVDNNEVRLNAERLIEEYSISCGGPDAPARTLSGGNMQKLILAKVLSRHPKLVIAAQPTSGLDVGSTQFITEKLQEQRSSGVGVLLISSDLNEIFSLSDRIACISGGRIMGIVPRASASPEAIGLMMGGIAKS